MCNIQLTFVKASKRLGIKITPQTLRERFCSEVGILSVINRYVDVFCGRVPSNVLARYYTDFSPERPKEIYEKVGLKIL